MPKAVLGKLGISSVRSSDKINSGDEEIIVAGQKQLAAYYEICLAVKKTFPKPETNENEEVNTNVDNN